MAATAVPSAAVSALSARSLRQASLLATRLRAGAAPVRTMYEERPKDHRSSPGMGSGFIRTRLDAIHHVKTPTPSFLSKAKKVSVIGAPMTFGQPFSGTDEGPQALRDAGLSRGLTKLGWRVQECGDLKFREPMDNDAEYTGPGNCKWPVAVGNACKLLSDTVYEHASKGNFSLVLGGDHSLALGSIMGILRARPETGIVWVDAHADINTPASSPSGNMHGMPLAFLMGLVEGAESIPGLGWLKGLPRLKPDQLVYIGLRDVDRGERDVIAELNIPAFTMYHVDRYGIGKTMELAISTLGDRPLHLSYDIDACDPVIAPATGTSVRGGLNFREAHFVAEAVAETGRLGSMDLVEVNPHLTEDVPGHEADTVDLGLALISSALGNRIL